jgi:WD40 repeat protein
VELPYLRIEAGDHTAIINRISLNQDRTLLLTVSDDKTARLWNLPGGELRGILRVPIGEGLEGSIYSGALSPDGKIALLAGYMTNNEDTFSLYLYDTSSLKMKSRLSKLPSETLHLAYTTDGVRFAAAFSQGIRVWDSSTGKKIAEDFKYGSSCNWITFASDGRMATSSDDGFIRIYDSQIQLLHQVKGNGGEQPYGLAFSEDSRLLAVGYKDKLKVEIIDAIQGKVMKSPSVDGLAGENLSSVAWSDGDLLAAGGAGKGDKRMIRRWPQNGGKPVDVPVAENTITSLATLPNGAWLYTTAEPSWGIVTSDSRFLVRHDAPVTDFRHIFRHHFVLSSDGLVVEWQLNSKQVARFDLPQQELLIDPPRNTGLTPPITNDALLLVSRWEDTTVPIFKDKYPIVLARNETSRSLAIAPDHSGFILGTDHYLRWFDAQGAELVKVDVPAAAYGVHISQDGRYLVAALADGALHWYRLHPSQPGHQARIEEYAGLFLSVDSKRWIAWTKEGFFAHSMNGGKNLAGYHLNRGSNKTPEWIDFGQLYQSFYSPSLLSRKMIGGHEAALQAQFAQAQEVINGLSVTPAPEVELVEYCLLENTDTLTRAFRRVGVESASVPVATSATPVVTIAATTPSPGTGSCVPIGKITTRAFSRTQQSVTPTTIPATTVAVAPEIKQEPVLQRDELPTGKKLVRLRFKLKERNGGVSEIHLLRNGIVVENTDAKTRGFSRATAAPAANTPSASAKEIAAKEGEFILERDLELSQGANRLQVRAYDSRNRAYGKSGLVELVVPAVATSAEITARGQKPTLHILSVGVNKYREAGVALRFAVKDAQDVASLLEKNVSSDFSKVSVLRLYDERATRSGIERAFDQIASQITSQEDVVVIYLAGHGMNNNNIYYFIPQDSLIDDYVQTAISQTLLGQKLAPISEKAKNVLIFLDSCHSGAYDVKSSDLDRQSESLSKARESFGELLMIAAAGAGEEAADEYITADNKHTGNGLFGYTVLIGLNGDAAGRRDKKVTALQIASFVHNEITEIRKQQPKYTQRPAAIPRGNDLTRLAFPLTAIKENP